MIQSRLCSIVLFIFINTFLIGQRPEKLTSSQLYNEVEKLGVVGTVLYLAAHPDDENTRLISYFANERKTRTAYLSLTRGDGGQNLIGTEIWEQLGLIRTNELLRARSTDGGQQFFSRANDFGFSKHPDETLAFWDKNEVMHDVIKVIREFKPDIIVNRFNHRTPGTTHGHHTSSAMLSVEAFDLVGDENQYKERLGNLGTWQPRRVFFNTSWWFYGSREKFNEADKTNLFGVDAGVYYPEIGLSNTEIAALSRSMHKSQGFGSTGTRGSETEYLELIKGDRPSKKDDPLSGIDITWNRLEGGKIIQEKIDALLASYDFNEPANNIPQLLSIKADIENIKDEHWKAIKLEEISDIIVQSAGLFLEIRAANPYGVRSESVTATIEAVNRSHADIHLLNVALEGQENSGEYDFALPFNERKNVETQIIISETEAASNPYWLNEKGSMGMYKVVDESIIGQPASGAAYTAVFEVTIDGIPFKIKRDVIYKRTDPVDGEVYSPFYVMPKASVAFSDPIYIFADRSEKAINVTLKSYTDQLKGVLTLKHPKSWLVTSSSKEINLENKGQEANVTFYVKGPVLSESALMQLEFVSELGEVFSDEVVEIAYDHIPKQVINRPAVSKFERLSIKTQGKEIAYFQGAGDNVPKSLRQIGYNVTEIGLDDIDADKLKNYDALVFGIRAFNTNKELVLRKAAYQQYMEEGGTVIVQYNTSRRIRGKDLAPYPLELSRDRVTDELARVSFLASDHEILNYPNKISSRDFENWVQERGLYFPNEWDEKYTAVLSCNDKGEPSRNGGLLVAPVGKGHFIYTGYSWFRQLPGGVPGAFRLFANMLSIGKNDVDKMDVKNSGGHE